MGKRIYCTCCNLTEITDPQKNGYGRVITIQGPEPGDTTTYTYDAFQRVRTITDSAGHTVTFDYDALDRVTLITYPDTTTEQFIYHRLDLFAQKDRRSTPPAPSSPPSDRTINQSDYATTHASRLLFVLFVYFVDPPIRCSSPFVFFASLRLNPASA